MILEGLRQNVSLKDYSTMHLGGNTRYLCEIYDPKDIPTIIEWSEANGHRVMMIGHGSNIIWGDSGFDGVVIVNKIPGFEIQDQGEQQFLIVGAGEDWDSVVERAVEAGLSGIEQLSLIPGSAGAMPVQNVGAYGREISEILVCVQAYDITSKKMVVLPTSDCEFGYRTSRFKNNDKGRFFITSITLSLTKKPPMPPYYASVTDYLAKNNISTNGLTSKELRTAVINIRESKLPNVKKVANCGSFFSNPIISDLDLEKIKESYPDIVYWELGNGLIKVSAGWIIEKLGLKGYHDSTTGMAIWDKQALILVNENSPSTAHLLAFRDAICAKVKDKFGIGLIQEPELIN